MSSIIVIGGGAIGATLTYRLTAAGADVTVLDAASPGGGTTSATFAMSIPSRKTPRAHYDFAVSGMAEHIRLVSELGLDEGDGWVNRAPAYEWATTDHDQAVIEARVARLQEWGYAAEWATGADLRAAEPHIAGPPADARVAVYPEEHWYDPDRMTRLVLDAAVRNGAVVHGTTPVDAIEDSGSGVVVRAGEATYRADRVVLCAGPSAREVARLAGFELPVRRVPGLVVRSAPVPAGTLRGVVMRPDVNIRPAPDGGLLAHSYTTEAGMPEGIEDPLNSELTRAVCDHATAMLPAFGEAGLVSARIGIRPVPADGMPITGWLDSSRVYAVSAHSGINFAPVLGRHAAPEVLGSQTSEALASFRPDRESLTAGASLDESTREMSRILTANT